ncbi:hypothetical protein X777_07084 [Ooceraea biroi]|nr:hypothetical protein X777_07084 [Ooceraea biroi]
MRASVQLNRIFRTFSYFITHLRFSDARNYLAAVHCILKRYETSSTLDISRILIMLESVAIMSCTYYNRLLLFTKYNKVRVCKSTPSVETKSLVFTNLSEDVERYVKDIPIKV